MWAYDIDSEEYTLRLEELAATGGRPAGAAPLRALSRGDSRATAARRPADHARAAQTRLSESPRLIRQRRAPGRADEGGNHAAKPNTEAMDGRPVHHGAGSGRGLRGGPGGTRHLERPSGDCSGRSRSLCGRCRREHGLELSDPVHRQCRAERLDHVFGYLRSVRADLRCRRRLVGLELRRRCRRHRDGVHRLAAGDHGERSAERDDRWFRRTRRRGLRHERRSVGGRLHRLDPERVHAGSDRPERVPHPGQDVHGRGRGSDRS